MNSPIPENLRVDYSGVPLLETEIDADPIAQFKRWFDEAVACDIAGANAMTLATTDQNGRPAARIVLLKDFDQRGFVFHTSYQGRKARHLENNPHAALVFYWEKLFRQVRIEGTVEKTTREESSRYFATRPRGAQIGTWASAQSTMIESRQWLHTREAELARSFEGKDVPLPDHWGGFRVKPTLLEFWQGQPSRLHDRLVYASGSDGSWKIHRLAP